MRNHDHVPGMHLTDKFNVAFLAISAFLSTVQGANTAPAQSVNSAGRALVFHFDTAGVKLCGKLTERAVYGPPGFGETPAKDVREEILILELPHAITVKPMHDARAKNSASLDVEQNVQEVQLFIGRTQTAEARKMVGRKIVVVGTLNEAIAPSQYTKVWMVVKSFSPN